MVILLKIKKAKKWIKIKNDKDNYKGYIKNKSFLHNQKNTHKNLLCIRNTLLKTEH